jgi:hypothetical protein
MTQIRIALSEKDLAEYGGPAVVTFDTEALKDLPCSRLVELQELAGGKSVLQWMADIDRVEADARRLAVWFARSQAGVVEPFHDFDPQVLRADFDYSPEVDDVDPPAEAPLPSSETSS